MEDKERLRLIKALNSLAEAGEERIAQREEKIKKEQERAERRKELYRRYYGSSSPMTFYVPKDSALLGKDNRKKSE